MKINRTEFLRSLQAVEFGLTDKPITEQSDCVAFRDGEIFTFNDHVACRAPSGLDKSFHGAVPGKRLLEALGKLPSDEIMVEMINGKFLVVDGKDRLWVTAEGDVSLPIEHIDKPKKWHPLAKEFCEAVDMVRHCTSTDETHFTMTCVNVTSGWVEACDFMQICRHHVETPIKSPFLMQGKWTKALKITGADQLSESDAWVHFKNPDGFVVSLRRYVDDYKDLSAYLKVKGTKTSLPKSLIEAVDLAKLFSAENADGDRVRIDLRQNKLVLTAESAAGGCRKVKKVAYDGQPLSFYVAPDVLAEVVKKHPECVLAADRLKVKADRFEYVLCLIPHEEKG